MDRQNIEEAIQSLDLLLRADSEREGDFQRWCELHPLVFLALGFHRQISHPNIQAADGNVYIPDFIAQRPNGSWEIIELKTPSAKILKNKDRRETFYSCFEDYLSQCHEYSEALDEASARAELESKYNIDLMHKRPTSILIAGSGEALDIDRLFRLCSRRNPPISVYTYDDIRSALSSYRTFNFGGYDSADGICVHSVLYIHKSEGEPTVNHILDIGLHPDRDRVAIFVDLQGFLRLRVWDSNGEQHNARAEKPFDSEAYDVRRWFLFEVGVSDGFGFISIQMEGRYYADIRIQDFPFRVSHEYVIGSDWEAKQPSWFSFVEMAVIDRALTFAEKLKLRQHAVNAGKEFPAELRDLKWSAHYSAGEGGLLVFKGHKWMHTARHPAAVNHS